MDEIEKRKEWQDHQYDPGYWTGSRMPYFIFNKKYKKLIIVLIVLNVLVLLASLM